MQRIHFTAADIARTRLETTAGPLVEAAFASGLFGRPVGPPYVRWSRQVAEQLPSGSPLRSRGRGVESDPEALLRLIERAEDRAARGAAHQMPLMAQMPPHRDTTGLSAVWRVAVAPYWDRMLAYLEAECEARRRVVMGGGVELLLATLHPGTKWRSQRLEIPGGPDEDVHLERRGIVLVPSVFLNHRPAQLTGKHCERGEFVLAFAAPPDARRAAGLWDAPDDRTQSLGALVGQTRAAALRVLRTTCTTSQLADRLGISAAGASQHATVLRQTGLITTRRIRNTALHTVSPLGLALLDGLPSRSTSRAGAVAEAPRPALAARTGRQVIQHASSSARLRRTCGM
ncbi:ArsR/SmtB family transcription factor [Streptomyces sp. NPDC053069]|uniref:ArsR/SmtB family transcription factor n=1 Tax=Streptomyces sp. NPDC053069 TaxID=3365695 RepID=UPI0037D09EFA